MAAIVLPILTLTCASFTVGLTFAPCYSSMCVERFFPYQTRIHIAFFYALIAAFILVLFAQRYVRPLHRFLNRPIATKPLFGFIRPTSTGRILLSFWCIGLAVVPTAYWLPAESSLWNARGALAGWNSYTFRVVWTGVTGHWIDTLIGLSILPVGRNSLIGHAFQAHGDSLLWAHKLLGYAVMVGGLIHGLLYYSFLAAWIRNTEKQSVLDAYTPDNPILTADEAEAEGPYSWFCLPTGAIAGIVLIPLTALISLPWFRRRHYNVFYFTHVIVAVAILILVCIHASTNFYFILPGLLLWVYDWTWRLRYALTKTVQVDLEDAGEGWCRIRLPQVYDLQHPDLESNRKLALYQLQNSPLQTYYINIRQISRLEIHPFTLASDSEDGSSVILFRKSPEQKKAKTLDHEWTWKLAALLSAQTTEKRITLNARLEGPYIPHIAEVYRSNHIFAIVGGTGITGAISLANWWFEHNNGVEPTRKSFSLIWTVRDGSTTRLSEIERLEATVRRSGNMSFQIHVSEKAGRVSPQQELTQLLSVEQARQGRAWVYASGPTSLLNDVEDSCVEQQKSIRTQSLPTGIVSLDFYIASYSL